MRHNLKLILLVCMTLTLQACGGIIPTPFDKQKDANKLFPISQSTSIQTVVAKVENNELSLELKYTGTSTLHCLAVATHAEFNDALADLVAGNLTANGQSYSCVLDEDNTTLDCAQPADASEFQ